MRTSILSLSRSATVRILLPMVWMAVIFTLSHQPTLPYPPDVNAIVISTMGHVGVYAILAALVWWALGLASRSRTWRGVLTVAIPALYGVTDEWHQSFVPGRMPDVRDIVADTVGALLALIAIRWLVRRRVFDETA